MRRESPARPGPTGRLMLEPIDLPAGAEAQEQGSMTTPPGVLRPLPARPAARRPAGRGHAALPPLRAGLRALVRPLLASWPGASSRTTSSSRSSAASSAACSQGDYDVPPGEELWGLLLVIALNKIRTEETFHRAAKRDVRLSDRRRPGRLCRPPSERRRPSWRSASRTPSAGCPRRTAPWSSCASRATRSPRSPAAPAGRSGPSSASCRTSASACGSCWRTWRLIARRTGARSREPTTAARRLSRR